MNQAVPKREIDDEESAEPETVTRSRPAPAVASASGTEAGRRWRTLAVTAGLGLASAGLYLLLFEHSAAIAALAAETRHGHKLYALVPMGIAVLFSLVHGSFTGHFWDVLGLKAKGH